VDGGAAMAIWLGLTMDGVPEAMVIGNPSPNPNPTRTVAHC